MGDTRIVDEALVGLIGAESEHDVYDAVVAGVHGLLPGSFIVITQLLSGTEYFRVDAHAGLDRLPRDPLRKLSASIPPPSPTASPTCVRTMSPAYRSGRAREVDGRPPRADAGQAAQAACAAIERLLGVRGRLRRSASRGDDIHYGDTLARRTQKATPITYAETIETLVHQATIAIRRLRAEDELRAKQAELDIFFTESLDLLCIADMDGYFRRVNPEWERTLGYSHRGARGPALPRPRPPRRRGGHAWRRWTGLAHGQPRRAS